MKNWLKETKDKQDPESHDKLPFLGSNFLWWLIIIVNYYKYCRQARVCLI